MYKIHAIGDSHVLHMGGLYYAHHICDENLQGATAHNLVEEHSTTRSREKLFKILDYIDLGTPVIMCFGEVDCRLHLRSKAMVQDTVSRYISVLNEIMQPLIVHEVIGAVPQDNTWRQPGYPDQKVRAEWVLQFNREVKEWCRHHHVPFLELGVSIGGVLPWDFTDDGVHLNSKAVPLYREWTDNYLGVTDEKSSLVSTRDGLLG